METFVKRTLTGLVFGIIVISSTLMSFYSMIFLFFIVNILALIEFYHIIKKNTQIQPQIITGLITSVTIYITSVLLLLKLITPKWFYLSIIPIFIIFITELWRKKETPIQNISITIMAIIYITLPLILLIFSTCPELESINYTPWWLMGFIIMIWTNDTGAYIIGIKFGKRKLFERISPKKSWEGFWGGAICSISAAFVISLFRYELSFIQWLGISIIVIIFATLGDLIESMFKRSLNIKDSGSLLPGHGGILDRFDALLGASPFLFVYLKLIQ